MNYMSIHPPDLHKLTFRLVTLTPSRPASTANGGSGCKSCRIVQYNMKSELRNVPSEDERKTDR